MIIHSYLPVFPLTQILAASQDVFGVYLVFHWSYKSDIIDGYAPEKDFE